KMVKDAGSATTGGGVISKMELVLRPASDQQEYQVRPVTMQDVITKYNIRAP
ncbi:MAG: hypothetical protein HY329_24830, partial [Chloroflexi bacterium]|nr:hypothetical protein [Chloroflexota bacterium]